MTSSEAAEVRLLSLAPAEAPFVLEQGDVARRARNLLGPKIDEFDRLAKLFGRAGIARRQAVKPIEWYETARDWPERTEAYLEAGTSLFVRAAENALGQAGVLPAAVDAVVTVSSTGIATPSLDARALGLIGLRPNVQRVPVFGLGCAGGVTGLSLAARLARGSPGKNVLLVVVELCTLSFRWDRGSKADVVATALFGDGAAGAVLRAEDGISRAARSSAVARSRCS